MRTLGYAVIGCWLAYKLATDWIPGLTGDAESPTGKSHPNCSTTKRRCQQDGPVCEHVKDVYHWLDLPAPYNYVAAYSTQLRCEIARREMNADHCIQLRLDGKRQQSVAE